MYLAVWCWSVGSLFGLVRLSKRIDFIGWGILCFSVYALLMTAHPQGIVFHAYLIGGWFLFRCIRLWRESGAKAAIQFIIMAATATLIGTVLAIPVYIDLARTFADSARVAMDTSFFTVVLPQLDSLMTAVRHLSLATFPEIFGNPISSSYPLLIVV